MLSHQQNKIKKTITFLFVLAIAVSFVSAYNFPQDEISVTTYFGNLTNLAQLNDTNIVNPTNLQLLQFQTGDNKWHPYTFSLSDWWDYDYADLINEPTALSEFSDDLGDRGYTSVSNFTNDNNYWNDTYATFNKTYADTLYNPLGTISNSTSWNRSGTDVYLANSGDSVGIGTSSPTSGVKLEVKGSSFAQMGIDATGSNDVALLFSQDGTPKSKVGWDESAGAFKIGVANPSFGTSEFVILNGTGNVGIGTTTPQAKLHVVGGILANGTINSTQDFCIEGGQCLSETGTGSIGGSGTTGYLPKFDTATDLGNSVIYQSGSNVGIGTSSPRGNLEIYDTGDNEVLIGSYAEQQSYLRFTENQRQGGFLNYDGSGNVFHIGVHDRINNDAADDYNAISILRSNGNVGVGTTNPAYKLDVQGGKMQINDGGATWYGSDSTGGFIRTFNGNTFRFLRSDSGESMRIDSSGNVGIGTTSPSSKLQIYSPSNGISIYESSERFLNLMTYGNTQNIIWDEGDKLAFGVSDSYTKNSIDTTHMLIDSSGNVGIGTTTPQNTLNVMGDLNVTEGMTLSGVSNITGQFDFNGGWTDGGSSMINGDIYAQTVYAYNYTGLNVGTVATNGSLLPTIDNSFDLGNATYRWKDAYFSGEVGIGTTSPSSKFQIGNPTGASTTIASNAANIYDDYGTGVKPTLNLFTKSSAINSGGSIGFSGENTATTPYMFGKIKGASETGTGYNGYLSFFTTASNSAITERMRIDSSGNVGIGTTTPNTNLELAGDVSTFRISDDVSKTPSIELLRGTGIFGSDFYADWKIYNEGGRLKFFTNSTSGSVQDNVMTMLQDGNVGIGTTSPAGKVHIYEGASGQSSSAANADGLVIEKNTDTGINILTNGSSAGGIYFGDEGNNGRGRLIYDHADNSMTLTTNSVERMRVDNVGNVGIGTSSPNAKFQVNGGIGLLQQYISPVYYNHNNGYLIATDIDATAYNRMIELVIEGNSYSSAGPVETRIQAYNYLSTGTLINTAGRSDGPSFDVDVFHYDGKVYFWFEQPSSYNTLRFRLTTNAGNHIISGVSNAIKPTSGVTNSVTITPIQGWSSYTDGSESGLDADLLDGYNSSVFLQSADITGKVSWTDLWGQVYNESEVNAINTSMKNYVDGEIAGIDTSVEDVWVNVSGDNMTGDLEINSGMSSYSTAFTSPHLKLSTNNVVDNTGFVGITFDSSTSANYGWSMGSLRSSSGASDFVWKRHDSGAEGIERMRLTKEGDLGIGTNNPIRKLTLIDSDVSGQLRLGSTESTYWDIGRSSSDGRFIINESSFGEAFSIDTSGNVGIGTSTPQNKLNVVGDLNVTGTIYGDLDLGSDYVPYTGSNSNVVLGDYNFSVGTSDLFVNANIGNVGIGTTTPQNTLNVVGDFNVTGNTYLGGNVTYTNPLWKTEELSLNRFTVPQGGNPPQQQVIDSTTAVFSFSPTSEEEIYLTTFPVNNWYEGTNFTIAFDWSPDSTDTGDVVWCVDIQAVSPNNGGYINSTTKSTYCVTDTALGNQYQALETEKVEVNGAGGTHEDLFMFRVYRDATDVADTFTDDAHLVEGRLKYQMDKPGTYT